MKAMSIIETPPMMIIGVIGNIETPYSLHTLTTVWASHLSDEVKHHFYKNWYCSEKMAFTHYAKKHAKDGGKHIARQLKCIRKYYTVVCVLLLHTQAHLMEIINGGLIVDKVKIAHSRAWIPPANQQCLIFMHKQLEEVMVSSGVHLFSLLASSLRRDQGVWLSMYPLQLTDNASSSLASSSRRGLGSLHGHPTPPTNSTSSLCEAAQGRAHLLCWYCQTNFRHLFYFISFFVFVCFFVHSVSTINTNTVPPLMV
jgi:hypothetical protein